MAAPPPGRPRRKLLGVSVEAALAARFEAWARQSDGSTSAALRRLIAQALAEDRPAPPRGAGTGTQVGVRLKPAERAALGAAAHARGLSPAGWLRALALAHLTRRPSWSPAELEALRDVFRELRTIGHAVERIAQAVEADGGWEAGQSEAVRAAAGRIEAEMRRVAAAIGGTLEQWGVPDGTGADAGPDPAAPTDGGVDRNRQGS